LLSAAVQLAWDPIAVASTLLHCFAIEDFVKSQTIALEQGEDACISLLQKWNQPRKRRLESKKWKRFLFVHNGMTKLSVPDLTTSDMIPGFPRSEKHLKLNWKSLFNS